MTPRPTLAQLEDSIREKSVPSQSRSWRSGIDHATLTSIRNALHNYRYKDVSMLKNPFDLGLYPQLLWKLKPQTILEIGSSAGGSALGRGDLCDSMGINCKIHSMDIVKITDVKHPRVTFYEVGGRSPGGTWPAMPSPRSAPPGNPPTRTQSTIRRSPWGGSARVARSISGCMTRSP